jgi:GTP 3',8-cyclase
MIIDKSGRSFKKLRISLTHECNYTCIYCSEGKKTINKESKNSYLIENPVKKVLPTIDLIEIIKKLHSHLNLNSIRLTGGEPLLHPSIVKIISSISEMGISNIGMTTNGHLLAKRADILKKAGLQSVNISIDALSDEKFTQMSGRTGLSRVLESINASIDQGLYVKLNTVVVAGQNEMEILPILDFAIEKGTIVRYLELMPMGPLHKTRNGLFFSRSQILELIQTKYSIIKSPKENSSTADYWSINGQKAFGIIANDSSPFCADCNRLRLDSYGNLYGCLSSLIPIPVLATTEPEALDSLLRLAITHKQPSHFVGNPRTMQSIGG